MLTHDDTEHALQLLHDVPGILGSFVCTTHGELVGRDLPGSFADATLSAVGPRAARILETWSIDPNGAECVLRFQEHKLFLRGLPEGVLCMLVGTDVHMPSMRTAAGMVARRLGSLRPADPVASLSQPPSPAADHSQPPTADDGGPYHGGAPSDRSAAPSSDATAETRPSDPAAPVSGPRRAPRAAPGSPSRATRRVRVYRGQRFES